MERSGKNLGSYRGECIDIQKVLEQISRESQKAGWCRDLLSLPNDQNLAAYHRRNTEGTRRLYLSTGVHGDEPAGPLAILQLLQENQWPAHIDVWLCPCINLTGFPLNTRENAGGIDLNRDYRHLKSPEVQAHAAWLRQQPHFDVAVCLHEDWEANGFYLYELNPDARPSMAEKVIENVASICPIEMAETVDGWEAQGGIIRPNVNPEEREQWPEAIFLLTHNTRQTYTFESPSDYPISIRVAAQVTAVRAVMEFLGSGV